MDLAKTTNNSTLSYFYIKLVENFLQNLYWVFWLNKLTYYNISQKRR